MKILKYCFAKNLDSAEHLPKTGSAGLKRGFSLVEVLVALVVISLAVGVSLLSVVNLLRRSNQAAMLINLAEVLMNEAERYINRDASRIYNTSYTVSYATRRYLVTVTVNSENLFSGTQGHGFQLYRNVGTPGLPNYQLVGWPQGIQRPGLTSVTIRVTDDVGRYIEAKIFPRQQ